MPSKSEQQRKWIFVQRDKYKSKDNTPEDMKWIWKSEWEQIEEQSIKQYESKFITESEDDFYDALFEYIGANIPLDINKYQKYLKPYTKRMTCYRMWQDISGKQGQKYIQNQNTEYTISKQSYYACAKSLKAIERIFKEDDFEPFTLISKHTGDAIDIVKCMEDIIKKEQDSFYKNVYKQFKYQEEVLLLNTIYYLNENNIIGYYNGKIVVPI